MTHIFPGLVIDKIKKVEETDEVGDDWVYYVLFIGTDNPSSSAVVIITSSIVEGHDEGLFESHSRPEFWPPPVNPTNQDQYREYSPNDLYLMALLEIDWSPDFMPMGNEAHARANAGLYGGSVEFKDNMVSQYSNLKSPLLDSNGKFLKSLKKVIRNTWFKAELDKTISIDDFATKLGMKRPFSLLDFMRKLSYKKFNLSELAEKLIPVMRSGLDELRTNDDIIDIRWLKPFKISESRDVDFKGDGGWYKITFILNPPKHP